MVMGNQNAMTALLLGVGRLLLYVLYRTVPVVLSQVLSRHKVAGVSFLSDLSDEKKKALVNAT